MLIKKILQSLDLGNSVAEFDKDLKTYFVETPVFKTLIKGEKDIVAGDKGTGKSALYLVLRERFREFPTLNDTEIIPAFNPAGNPVFQRLAQVPRMEEGQYTSIWKSYFLSLVGNWILEYVGESQNESFNQLDKILRKLGLRSADNTAQTIFSKLINQISRIFSLKTAEVGVTVTEAGMPVFTPKIEFG